jgi:hypothetical protein
MNYPAAKQDYLQKQWNAASDGESSPRPNLAD